MFLSKLAETTASLIHSSGFLEDGDIFHAAEVSQSSPNRRSSLNLIPFYRVESEVTLASNSHESSGGEVEERVVHRLIQMPDSFEEVIELIFLEFACMEHSRNIATSPRPNDAYSLSETYMTKRNFLAMCLVLDLIDSRCVVQASWFNVLH